MLTTSNDAIRIRINQQVLLVPVVEMFDIEDSRSLTIPVCGSLADFLRIFADFFAHDKEWLDQTSYQVQAPNISLANPRVASVNVGAFLPSRENDGPQLMFPRFCL